MTRQELIDLLRGAGLHVKTVAQLNDGTLEIGLVDNPPDSVVDTVVRALNAKGAQMVDGRLHVLGAMVSAPITRELYAQALRIAGGYARRYALERSEIEGNALLGLSQALAVFDGSRGTPVVAFCSQYIHWAITKGLRLLIENNRYTELDETHAESQSPSDCMYDDQDRIAVNRAIDSLKSRDQAFMRDWLEHGSDSTSASHFGFTRQRAHAIRKRIEARLAHKLRGIT